MMTPRQQRLHAMTQQTHDSNCWIWQGQVSNSGYGRVMETQPDRSTKMVSAQTASYHAFVGAVPDGHLVRQRCGQRLCINPDHLELLAV
ncbi:MAG: hypothetical protein HKP12_13290 [Gammaproteobacteria bacterium]|nr:hypothetical protein [Gammaproteobacteria bacterium]